MTTISRMNFGPVIVPTFKQVSRAYSSIGALFPRSLMGRGGRDDERMPSDMDPSFGIFSALVLSFWTFVVVSWGISSWV